ALHHQSILVFILALLVGQFLLSVVRTSAPTVLGIQTNVKVEELLLLTNKKREEQGLLPLGFNEELTKAAAMKAQDMISKDYWAHNAPDGVTPWAFFNKVNYGYLYAGENLARGFTKSEDVVKAWLASPSHRDNMLSQNYDEIGFAVAQGKLLGEETTLVVEFLGSRTGSEIAKKPMTAEVATSKTVQEEETKQTFTFAAGAVSVPLIGSQRFSLTTGIMVMAIFIFTLILDMIIVMRKKIVRLVGHNLDHIFFFAVMILILFIISKGAIL
ncbi:MAG: hypothetical protein HY429_03275, partial [Candidatus Levybacteria bacterium]|nr:hypothetical protein [Candidatus Levybacteria bacterium]